MSVGRITDFQQQSNENNPSLSLSALRFSVIYRRWNLGCWSDFYFWSTRWISAQVFHPCFFHLCLQVIYGEASVDANLHSIRMLTYFMLADKFWVQTRSKYPNFGLKLWLIPVQSHSPSKNVAQKGDNEVFRTFIRTSLTCVWHHRTLASLSCFQQRFTSFVPPLMVTRFWKREPLVAEATWLVISMRAELRPQWWSLSTINGAADVPRVHVSSAQACDRAPNSSLGAQTLAGVQILLDGAQWRKPKTCLVLPVKSPARRRGWRACRFLYVRCCCCCCLLLLGKLLFLWSQSSGEPLLPSRSVTSWGGVNEEASKRCC